MSNLKSLPALTLLTFLKESYFPPVTSQFQLPRISFPLTKSKVSFILYIHIGVCARAEERALRCRIPT